MEKKIQVGVIGLWHLGCVVSAAWSSLGFQVKGFDYSVDVIDGLGSGKPPVFEPGLEELIRRGGNEGTLRFTNNIADIKDCDFVFITYDTKVLDDDESDLTFFERTIDNLIKYLKGETLVIVSSQVPVGTCGKFRSALQKGKDSIELVYSPENLRLGEAISCYLNPGRIIIGAESEEAKRKSVQLFDHIKAEKLVMNLASAEMVKHGINAFLAMSIVFADNLADLCEVAGANIFDVARGMRTDSRIGEKAYLSPGVGFSGGTLGRDLKALSHLNENFQKGSKLFELVHRFNSERKSIILEKVKILLKGDLRSKIISVLGLTYKPGTDTLRRSLPLEIVKLIVQNGATVKAFDPKANYKELTQKPGFIICDSIGEAIKESDLILLLTEWPEFRDYHWENAVSLSRGKILFDTKNFLYNYKVGLRSMGYHYVGTGVS